MIPGRPLGGVNHFNSPWREHGFPVYTENSTLFSFSFLSLLFLKKINMLLFESFLCKNPCQIKSESP